ncbi:MAG: low-specificity L-threonine aldolase [Chloroflexi bacterium]|nr:low-specificity L-threonine aldolase [Chloroflexota bacterium]
MTIDLRSDTVTQPTPEMRRAMMEAEVGDDGYGEDPTVNRLQELAAEMTGKEAALFVTSGTQGNMVSLLAHCGRGDEVIVGDRSHTYLYEQGGMAQLGGIHPRVIPNRPDGTLDPEDILQAIRPDNIHFPRTRLVVLENTHNFCYGAPLTPEYTRDIGNLAHERGLKLHIDGARIFNAAVALGVDVRELTAPADSITFCLSKGLSAPVGSVVCGSRDFIEEARRVRKVLGGGMRQAGVIAAAGIVALTQMVDRLAEDHANARRLAEGLAQIPGFEVALERVYTNIVYVDVTTGATAAEVVQRAEEMGVRVLALGPYRIRAVTHYGITEADIDRALDIFDHIARQMIS